MGWLICLDMSRTLPILALKSVFWKPLVLGKRDNWSPCKILHMKKTGIKWKKKDFEVGSCYQSGKIFPSFTGTPLFLSWNLIISVTNFGWGRWEFRYWHLGVETRDVAKYPIMHRAAPPPPKWRIVLFKMSLVPRLGKPGFGEGHWKWRELWVQTSLHLHIENLNVSEESKIVLGSAL